MVTGIMWIYFVVSVLFSKFSAKNWLNFRQVDKDLNASKGRLWFSALLMVLGRSVDRILQSATNWRQSPIGIFFKTAAYYEYTFDNEYTVHTRQDTKERDLFTGKHTWVLALIFPSMPRSPKPPAPKIPSTPSIIFCIISFVYAERFW